ncbi:hypothetical protein [Demequina iriomotensis]|uniref:hypothetical protein n=1 Tax=Demequina iriomotensis TaxID=1536641 RepID=UPI000785B0EF|nr:hypothetical protein [Demequina iriomotensis]
MDEVEPSRPDEGDSGSGGRFRASATAVACVIAGGLVGVGLAVTTIADHPGREFWSLIAVSAVAVAAFGAAIGGVVTLRKRNEAAHGADWWRRAQKVNEYLTSGEDRRIYLGAHLLDALEGDDRCSGRPERLYLDAITIAAALDDASDEPMQDPQSAPAPSDRMTPGRRTDARIRAARANIRNAAKLGKIPDPRIVEIAQTPMSNGEGFDAAAYLNLCGVTG